MEAKNKFLSRHPSTSGFWRRHLGAKHDPHDTSPPPIFLRFFAVFYTHFTQGVHITLPFILASYMVRDFAQQGKVEAEDEQTLGRLIGFLGAAFCGTQFTTGYPIGRLSDYIGRKPIMVIGNVSCMLSATLFGLSDTYLMAILSRAVGGLFNGIIGAEKAILGEALTAVEQGKAFAYFSIAWGLGALMGPLLGGIFSLPCAASGMLRATAVCAPGSLLERRPFLLPCLLAAGLSVLALLLTLFFLEETLPKLRQGGGAGGAGGGAADGQKGQGRLAEEEDADGPAGEEELLLAKGDVSKWGMAVVASPAGDNAVWEVELGLVASDGHHGADTGNVLIDSGWASSAPPFRGPADGSAEGQQSITAGRDSSLRPGAAQQGLAEGHSREPRRTDTAAEEELSLLSRKREPGHGPGHGPLPAPDSASCAVWYKEKSVLLALGGYGLIAFFYNYSDEVLPIFASAPPQEGGLGFTTSQLAPSLSFGGTVLMLWSLFGFPALLKRFGTKCVVQIGLWQTPLFAALLPLASLFAGRILPAQLIMFVGMGLRGIASTNSFTACIIMVNQLAPEGALGSVNGAGQSLASFVRAAAPALGGISWGWSVALGFPGHQFLPFLFIAAVALGTLLVYRKLEPPQVDMQSTAGAEDA